MHALACRDPAIELVYLAAECYLTGRDEEPAQRHSPGCLDWQLERGHVVSCPGPATNHAQLHMQCRAVHTPATWPKRSMLP